MSASYLALLTLLTCLLVPSEPVSASDEFDFDAHERRDALRASIAPRIVLSTGESYLRAIAAPEAGRYEFVGPAKPLWKLARKHYENVLSDQMRDDFMRSSGGSIFVDWQDAQGRAAQMLGDHYAGRRPQTLWDALEARPPRRARQTVGSAARLGTLAGWELSNDLHLAYEQVDLDLPRLVDEDVGTDSAGTGKAFVVLGRGPALPERDTVWPVRRQLIPTGNLYTGDYWNLDGKILVHLKRRSDILDTLASSMSLRLRATIFGGARHRALVEVAVEGRMRSAKDFAVTVEVVALPF
jgi:hypothetical protein